MDCRSSVPACVVVRPLLCALIVPLFAVGCGGSKPAPDVERAEASAPPAPVQSRPNIVIVLVDTLRQDALRAYNDRAQTLDALDAFSERAAVFENALAPASWTLPSVTSLLTGLYPDRHGVAHPRIKLPVGVATIATTAHEAGYETIAFTDGAYLSPQFGLAHGFEWFNDTAAPDARPMPGLPRGGAPTKVSGEALFDRAMHYLNTRKAGDRPFLLLLHTYSVHDYFREHPWAKADVDIDYELGENALYCLIDQQFCTDGIWPYFRALYDAEVRHVNAGFSELMQTLDDRGLADSTIVLFTADHGEGFEPKRNRVHHGGRLHLDVIRVPFLMAGPGVTPGRVGDPVSLVDVMPTLLDEIGLPTPENVDGVSLLPRLNGTPIAERPLFALEYFYWWDDGKRRDVASIAVFPLAEAVLDGGRWLTRHQSETELTDLVPGTPALGPDQVSATLAAMMQILRARDTRLHPGDSREEDPELQEKLRSLGYVN